MPSIPIPPPTSANKIYPTANNNIYDQTLALKISPANAPSKGPITPGSFGTIETGNNNFGATNRLD
jgi:hypothetical protein